MLPPGFVLGTASSAFQVEGAAAVDGKGPSIWDTFAARGRIAGGRTGDPAVGHYERVSEDVALLKRLGVGGHRFSISWSRVVPDGRGPVNAAGLDFYDRLVDELLAAGIEPTATLYHWDLPQGLEDDGGWLNRDTIDRFADYAAVVGERLVDRVAHWVPVNSPNLAALLGYVTGLHAPGRALFFDGLPAAHHLLVAHGRAVVALREAGAASIGCSNHHSPMWPASDSAADVGATKLFDALFNGMFLEPMLLGRYPADLELLLEEVIEPGDMAVIRQPLDFYGVSYYRPIKIAATPEEAEIPFELLEPLGHPLTAAGWAVVPEALRELLIMLRARYRAAMPPIVVTECGAAFDDADETDETDEQRIDYLARHLEAVSAAAQRGVDVRGFFVWTLLDNLAWTDGFDLRYGLVAVDPDTLERTPRASFDWFADVIAAQPRSLG